MEFLISSIVIIPILLAVVGLLGGFFGVGGGFLPGLLMFWAGVPMNFVVGTDLAHMTGKSIVAMRYIHQSHYFMLLHQRRRWILLRSHYQLLFKCILI